MSSTEHLARNTPGDRSPVRITRVETHQAVYGHSSKSWELYRVRRPILTTALCTHETHHFILSFD